jgi:hypothetical protein
MTKPALHAEAVRLRLEERLSLREIHLALGLPKSTLSVWLRDVPLRPEEMAYRNRRRPGPPRKVRGEESTYHRAIAGQKLTSDQKGRIAEAAVYLRLMLRGFTVYQSPF